jgi:hypothetical protein
VAAQKTLENAVQEGRDLAYMRFISGLQGAHLHPIGPVTCIVYDVHTDRRVACGAFEGCFGLYSRIESAFKVSVVLCV